ncbi:general stress protein [Paenibacillus sp. GCM10028914]|uniref:general stress protein n=1 Tax=Paenibacillus sp. GCM10028914 TaxID=3273416 RepID=UPI00360E16C9
MAILMVGIYEAEADVYQLVKKLEELGFNTKEISLIGRRVEMLEDLSELAGTQNPDTGMASSGLLGSLRMVLSGFDVLTEPIAAVGPVAERAAGAGIGSKEPDSLAIALRGLGIPEEDAKSYERQVEADRMLLLLECDKDQQEQVADLFKETGALNA